MFNKNLNKCQKDVFKKPLKEINLVGPGAFVPILWVLEYLTVAGEDLGGGRGGGGLDG